MKKEDCILFSGGAQGAEAAFGAAAERTASRRSTSPSTGTPIARTRGIRVLNHEELQKGDVSLTYVSRLMHRAYPAGAPMLRKVLQSIWYQVNDGQEVYVVGKIMEDDTVRGGTGWGAEFAKICNKPLFVFDQEQNGWFTWEKDRWERVRHAGHHPRPLHRHRHPLPRAERPQGDRGSLPGLVRRLRRPPIGGAMNGRRYYFDHNATTPLHPEVKAAITEALDSFGNPSSLHAEGRAARRKVEAARETVARFINASPDEITFVGSGSEGNNTILSSLTSACGGCSCDGGGCPPRALVTTAIEHPCILESSKCLRERGVEVHFAGVDEFGKVIPEKIGGDDHRADRPGLGDDGQQRDRHDPGHRRDRQVAHAAGALVHTDAVQAVGKMPVDVQALGVDFLTLSGHKIYGPKGIGAIYVRRGSFFCPLIRGGHQERGRRAGTENTIGIVALGKAVEMRAREMADEAVRLTALREELRAGIDRAPCPTCASTATRPTACRARSTSPSTASRARRSCSTLTWRGSPSRPARPAPPARSTRRT